MKFFDKGKPVTCRSITLIDLAIWRAQRSVAQKGRTTLAQSNMARRDWWRRQMAWKICKLAIALSALTLTIVGTPANADNIVVDQWYNAFFGNVAPGPVFGPANNGLINGPLPGGGTGNAIPAPAGAAFSITLPVPGYVTFTDLEAAGEQFQVFVNGVAATPTTNNLNPTGQAALIGGLTSNTACIACTIAAGVDIG